MSRCLSILLDMAPTGGSRAADLPEWAWELNGAGDPRRVWIDHADSGKGRKGAPEIDAGFESGTWVIRLTLPERLGEVTDAVHPALIAMGLADAAQRLEAKLHEAVDLCRARGLTWERIGLAIGVTRQAAQQRFGKSARGRE